MGRLVRRVPIGFDWPMKATWFGFVLPPVHCELCGGSGRPKHGGKILNNPLPWEKDGKPWESEFCPTCEGEGRARVKVPVPDGPGWQMWEDTSEGSPISPVFETPEGLARWLADHKASAFGGMTCTYDQWLAMIRGPGWSPCAVITDAGMKSGVELAGEAKGGES